MHNDHQRSPASLSSLADCATHPTAMAGSDPSRSPPKAGITFTRDFEIVEMSSLSTTTNDKDQAAFNSTTSYAVSTAPRPVRYANQKAAGQRWVDSFKQVEGSPEIIKDGYYVTEGMEDMPRDPDRYYDLHAANARTANSALVRDLKGRHLQMIAIGGSIGTRFTYPFTVSLLRRALTLLQVPAFL